MRVHWNKYEVHSNKYEVHSNKHEVHSNKISKVVLDHAVGDGAFALDAHKHALPPLAGLYLPHIHQLDLLVDLSCEAKLLGLDQPKVIFECPNGILDNKAKIPLVSGILRDIALVAVGDSTSDCHEQHFEADEGVLNQ
jgi:hypothetical protein